MTPGSPTTPAFDPRPDPSWLRTVPAINAVTGAVAYATVAVHSAGGGLPDRLLAAAAAVLAVGCLVSVIAAGWWRVATAAAMLTACAFVIGYDVVRTPTPQWFLDACFAVVLVLELAFIIRLITARSARDGAAGLIVIPALVLLGLWSITAAAPATVRPRLEVTARFGASTVIDDTSGHRDHVAVSATVTVHNAGGSAAQIAGSFYNVTALTSAAPSRPIGADTARGFEDDIRAAISSARALTPLQSGGHRLSGLWPTADPAQNLLQLDEIVPAGTTIAAHTTYRRTLSVDVPLLIENPVTTIDLRATVVGAPTGIAVHSCPSGGSIVSCTRTDLPVGGPLGRWLADDPTLQLFVCVGDPAVAGSEPGQLLAGFGTAATPTGLRSDRLRRFTPVAVSTTEATREVNALAAP